MTKSIKKSAQTDDIADTINYKAVAKRLITFVKASRIELVEALAEKVCEIILTEFNVSRVKLTLNKGEALTGAEGVGVIIERSK